MDDPGDEFTHDRKILLALVLGSALISLGVPFSVLFGGQLWPVLAVGGGIMIAAAIVLVTASPRVLRRQPSRDAREPVRERPRVDRSLRGG